jgi:hypothetical protein
MDRLVPVRAGIGRVARLGLAAAILAFGLCVSDRALAGDADLFGLPREQVVASVQGGHYEIYKGAGGPALAVSVEERGETGCRVKRWYVFMDDGQGETGPLAYALAEVRYVGAAERACGVAALQARWVAWGRPGWSPESHGSTFARGQESVDADNPGSGTLQVVLAWPGGGLENALMALNIAQVSATMNAYGGAW